MVYIATLLFGHGVSVPTEAEDSVVDMIGKYWSHLTSPGTKGSSARRGSVDSCDGGGGHTPLSTCSPCEEQEELQLQQEVTRQIESRLTQAKASLLQCQVLLLPRHLTLRLGRDVLRFSSDEPCGLRGASIGLYVEGQGGLKSLGSVRPDPSVTPTFELSVILKADESDGWPPLKRFVFDAKKVLKLKAEYRLVKMKLYSSASPVIQEFSSRI